MNVVLTFWSFFFTTEQLSFNSSTLTRLKYFAASASPTACSNEPCLSGLLYRKSRAKLCQSPPAAANAAPGPIVVRTVWQEAKNRVRLSVLDQGSGFAEAILKRAFEPYVTTKIKGTGLGLAVVKKIADEHGSRVDIANRFSDGKVVGAQVSLSLPVVNS